MPNADFLSGSGSRFRLRAWAVDSIRSLHCSTPTVVPMGGPVVGAVIGERSQRSNVLVTCSMIRKREDGGVSGLKLDHFIRAELSASEFRETCSLHHRDSIPFTA